MSTTTTSTLTIISIIKQIHCRHIYADKTPWLPSILGRRQTASHRQLDSARRPLVTTMVRAINRSQRTRNVIDAATSMTTAAL